MIVPDLPAEGARCARTRGAVALEYILIIALVAIAGISAFRLWGDVTAQNVKDTIVDSSGALEAP